MKKTLIGYFLAIIVILVTAAATTPILNLVLKGDMNANGYNITNISTLNTTNLIGTYISGSGTNITGIQASNVVGTLPQSDLPSYVLTNNSTVANSLPNTVVSNSTSAQYAPNGKSLNRPTHIFFVDDYGAKPDRVDLNDTTVTLGSAQISSPSANWSSSDVGKGIIVYTNLSVIPLFTNSNNGIVYQNNMGYTVSTITSVQNSTNCTIAQVIYTNLVTRVIYATDSTIGISNANQNAWNSGWGRVDFDGRYVCFGSLQDPNYRNSVILLPNDNQNTPKSVMWEGVLQGLDGADGFYAYQFPTNGSSVLFAINGTGVNPSAISGSYTNAYVNDAGKRGFSKLYMKELEIDTMPGSGLSGINEMNGGGASIFHVAIVKDGPKNWNSAGNLSISSNTNEFGIFFPSVPSDGVNRVDSCFIGGYGYGIVGSDHQRIYNSTIVLNNIGYAGNYDAYIIGTHIIENNIGMDSYKNSTAFIAADGIEFEANNYDLGYYLGKVNIMNAGSPPRFASSYNSTYGKWSYIDKVRGVQYGSGNDYITSDGLSNTLFRIGGLNPGNSTPYIVYHSVYGMDFNVPTSSDYQWQVNGNDMMLLQQSGADTQSLGWLSTSNGTFNGKLTSQQITVDESDYATQDFTIGGNGAANRYIVVNSSQMLFGEPTGGQYGWNVNGAAQMYLHPSQSVASAMGWLTISNLTAKGNEDARQITVTETDTTTRDVQIGGNASGKYLVWNGTQMLFGAGNDFGWNNSGGQLMYLNPTIRSSSTGMLSVGGLNTYTGGITNLSTQPFSGNASALTNIPGSALQFNAATNGASISLSQLSTTTLTNNFYYGSTTATNVVVYTVPSGVTNTYEIGGWVNVTAISVDVLNFQVLFTDENGTSQTIAADANVTATGFNTISTQSIRAKGGTAITVKGNLVTGTGSITYDIGGFIKPVL